MGKENIIFVGYIEKDGKVFAKFRKPTFTELEENMTLSLLGLQNRIKNTNCEVSEQALINWPEK